MKESVAIKDPFFFLSFGGNWGLALTAYPEANKRREKEKDEEIDGGVGVKRGLRKVTES